MLSLTASRPARRPLLAAISVSLAAVLVGSIASPAIAAQQSGFRTSRPAMLLAAPGGSVLPIISVFDTVGSYQFQGIPDGISILKADKGSNDDVFVNHETSKVPFPLVPPTADARNAEVSRLVLNKNAEVLSGEIVIRSALGFQRFCSNFLASKDQGFEHPVLFTGEEASDFVFRREDSWPAPASEPPSVQAGQVVAYDIETGASQPIPRLGRMNHENAVALPKYKQIAILTGDDTFAAPSSQLYLFLAPDENAVWNNQGHLWAFRSDMTTINDYGDLGAGQSVSGSFIAVPDDIAEGVPGNATTGPQGALETWSNANNVFQFIRVEDIAYDRDDENVVYFADTGEPRAQPTGAGAARLTRGPSSFRGPWMNGRIWKMVLDKKDPTIVESLSILPNANFDLGGYSNAAVPHNPDNVETVKGGLLFTEDPGTHNSSADPTFPTATTARVWHYNLATGALTEVARVDQSQDPAAARGAWEASGIVDASARFGKGAFLIDVQAHTLLFGPMSAKTEDGQLLLLRLPKSLTK